MDGYEMRINSKTKKIHSLEEIPEADDGLILRHSSDCKPRPLIFSHECLLVGGVGIKRIYRPNCDVATQRTARYLQEPRERMEMNMQLPHRFATDV